VQRRTFDEQEKRSTQKDVKDLKENIFEEDFEQLARELEFVEHETGLQDAFLFLKFDKYYNSWNKPLN
jgi:thioesterase domain-containing protein